MYWFSSNQNSPPVQLHGPVSPKNRNSWTQETLSVMNWNRDQLSNTSSTGCNSSATPSQSGDSGVAAS